MVDAYSMRKWELSGQSGHDHFFDTFDKFIAATYGKTGEMPAETAARAASQREVYQELMHAPAFPETLALANAAGTEREGEFAMEAGSRAVQLRIATSNAAAGPEVIFLSQPDMCWLTTV